MHRLKFLLVLPVLMAAQVLPAQKISSRLHMEQDDTYEVRTEMKNVLLQQVGGQSFDFTIDATAISHYTVTNTTEENISLRHKLQRLQFAFDGLGSKRGFDSDDKKDLASEFGRPVRDMLAKSYDMIIDSLGKTLIVLAPTAAPSQGEDQFRLISGMLGDLSNIAMPPQKGDPTLFMTWPGGELAVGESWSIHKDGEKEKYNTRYILSEITDSTYIIDFSGTGTSRVDNEFRGMVVSTNFKTSTTGKIIADRKTGLVLEKTTTTDSNGTSEMMGGSTPVSSKTSTKMVVKKTE